MRGGIVGCGFFAQFHTEAWQRIAGVQLVAACDLDLSRAQAAAPAAYTDLEQMLDQEKLDFLDIAARPEWHLPMLKIAAQRGIPVICQKPMAPTFAECLEMVEVARVAGIRLMIHENWRWQQWFREIHTMIHRGDIGHPITYHFRTRRRDGLGAEPYAAQPYFRNYKRLLLYETLIHHIDTARFLFGDIKRVYAELRRNNPLIQGEDQALLLTTHKSELRGIIDGHRFLDLAVNSGPLGDAFFEGDEGMLWLHPLGDVYHRNAIGEERLAWKNTAHGGYRGDSVHATQQHFIDCLRSGAPFESDAASYLQSVAVMEAGYRSAEEGRAVSLESGT